MPDERGADVPPRTMVRLEHEIQPGVTVMCQGTDLCRFCQLAKRRARKDRAADKAAGHRSDRRASRQALSQGEDPAPLKRRRLLPKRRVP